MGHWLLEVGKFSMYVSLPLGAFYYFNSPEFYTDVLYKWGKKTQTFTKNHEQILKERKQYIENMEKDQTVEDYVPSSSFK